MHALHLIPGHTIPLGLHGSKSSPSRLHVKVVIGLAAFGPVPSHSNVTSSSSMLTPSLTRCAEHCLLSRRWKMKEGLSIRPTQLMASYLLALIQ